MPEYLTKEEVRQWRSSLERITLEEFAARLGKVVQGEKHTNDMIDKVMTHSLNEMSSSGYDAPRERLQTLVLGKNITEHKEHTVVVKPHNEVVEKAVKSVEKPAEKPKKVKEAKETKVVAKEEVKEIKDVKVEETKVKAETSEYTFKKPLIPREQMIFNYLLEHKGEVVYAKDMAALLNLQRDYVYKYIKNLRQKLNEDALTNANNGGYVLS